MLPPVSSRLARMAENMERYRAQDPDRYRLCWALARVTMGSFDYWWAQPEYELQAAKVYYLEDGQG